MALLQGDTDYDSHELGIISHVAFGLRDGRGSPMLSFSVDCYPSHGCLQCLVGDDIKSFLSVDYRGKSIWVADVKLLEGVAVVVKKEGNFLRLVGLWNYKA